ncbi:MAG: hypothetical protein ACYTHM_02610, partial [Planctomycetota bacterium]
MRLDRREERLLEAVLHDEEVEGFREALALRGRRELARRRRPLSRFLWVVPAAASILFALLLAVDGLRGREPVTPPNPPPNPVETSSYWVSTRSLPPACVVTTKTVSIPVVHTRPAPELYVTPKTALETVRTGGATKASRLSDEEVLTLLGGIPCGFVAVEEDEKRLVILDPACEADLL